MGGVIWLLLLWWNEFGREAKTYLSHQSSWDLKKKIHKGGSILCSLDIVVTTCVHDSGRVLFVLSLSGSEFR